MLRVHNNKYVVRSPTVEERFEAEEYYKQAIEQHKYSGLLYHEDLMRMYIQSGMLEEDYKKKLSTFVETIDNIKIELYKCAFKDRRKKIRARLNAVREAFSEYRSHISLLDQFSLEGLALSFKARWLFIHTCEYENGDRVFTDDCIVSTLYDSVSKALVQNSLGEADLRHISRHSMWRSIWNNKKYDAFETKSSSLNEEQKSLVYYSQFYDFVFNHPERPSSDIIEDDDRIDGWQLTKVKEMQSKDKQQKINDLVGNDDGRWQETYIPVKSAEEAKEIYALNDVGARQIISQREHLIKAKGTVKESEFADKRLAINRQSTEQYQQHSRK